jgi:hypothetical protein
VVLKGAYFLVSDSGASISGAFDAIVDPSGFRRDINWTEPLIGVGDFPKSVDYADRTLFGYSRGSFMLFSDEIDGMPITMNLERLEVGRDSSLEFYSLAAIPEPSAFALLGASGAFLLLRRRQPLFPPPPVLPPALSTALTQKQISSSPPPGRGRGKTEMKPGSENQFHKSGCNIKWKAGSEPPYFA